MIDMQRGHNHSIPVCAEVGGKTREALTKIVKKCN
jgi:hypothetical protein